MRLVGKRREQSIAWADRGSRSVAWTWACRGCRADGRRFEVRGSIAVIVEVGSFQIGGATVQFRKGERGEVEVHGPMDLSYKKALV